MTNTTWTKAAVGCHWTHPAYPNTVVSTISDPDYPAVRYSATVDYRVVALTRTLDEAIAAAHTYLIA